METPQGEPGGGVYERRRAEILGVLPARYSPALHVAIPAVLGLAVMIGALSSIHDLRPIELVTVPLALVLAFGFEWRVHKSVLHKRTRGLQILYERHELQHHVVFTDEHMEMRGRREAWLILMPPYAVVLVALLEAPLAFAVARLTTPNAGCLFLVASMFFFLSYEWLHLAYHLPRESFIGRLALIALLREHHRRHHAPRLMKRWNFNVTVPVFDWIYRTVWSPEREAERASRRGAPAADRA